jgi:two-component system sensor histidine kinase/response regulator
MNADVIDRLRDELAAARQDAATARAAKSAFLARMSHEMRTPLNTIIGQNHIMLRDVADPALQAHIDKVLDAAQQLLALVDDILDLSQLEGGKVTLEQHVFQVDSVLAGVTGRVSAQAHAKGLTLATFVAEDVPRVLRGDAARLRKLLYNYATNAIKFTDQGSVQLDVHRVNHGERGDMLRFGVTDTGIGLTQEQRSHLFQAFEQVDGGVARRFGGTGLGLAVCRELAALMGGRVGVDSQPGVGSTFWFEAPFATGEADAAPRRTAVAEQARTVAGRRVLLVDDDPLSNEVAEFLLRLAGFEVDVARDGLEAVERAASSMYAAVLMDVQMPHMDGLEASRVIRRLPAQAATPIIALTASVFEEDRRACIDAGMSDLVAKPIDPTHLAAVLARWVPALAGAAGEAATAVATHPHPSAGAPVPDGGDLTLRDRLLRLQQLVATDDIEARNCLRALPPGACGTMHAELRRRLDDFDYDQAAILIARRLQQLEEEQGAMDRD